MPTITRTIGAFHDASNARIRKIGQYTGPASYATGGDPFTAANLGMSTIELLVTELAVNAAGTVRGLQYDTAAGLLRWIVLDTGAEVAATTDLSGFSARFEAIGK